MSKPKRRKAKPIKTWAVIDLRTNTICFLYGQWDTREYAISKVMKGDERLARVEVREI